MNSSRIGVLRGQLLGTVVWVAVSAGLAAPAAFAGNIQLSTTGYGLVLEQAPATWLKDPSLGVKGDPALYSPAWTINPVTGAITGHAPDASAAASFWYALDFADPAHTAFNLNSARDPRLFPPGAPGSSTCCNSTPYASNTVVGFLNTGMNIDFTSLGGAFVPGMPLTYGNNTGTWFEFTNQVQLFTGGYSHVPNYTLLVNHDDAVYVDIKAAPGQGFNFEWEWMNGQAFGTKPCGDVANQDVLSCFEPVTEDASGSALWIPYDALYDITIAYADSFPYDLAGVPYDSNYPDKARLELFFAPEPASLALLGFGIACTGFFHKRKFVIRRGLSNNS